MQNTQEVYLDHAAATYLLPEALTAMLPFFNQNYANTKSIHQQGEKAAKQLQKAKNKISRLLNCQPEELTFTNSGTEANFLAIIGYAQANKSQGNHIISTQIEHPSTLTALQELEKQGFQVTYLKPDQNGLINPQDLQKAITKTTILVTIIHAHNEIGTIQDIAKIHQITSKQKIPLHLDCCQSPNTENLKNIQAELITLNASKIYGPKGIGLFKKSKNLTLIPFIKHQSTINLPGIIGFTKAFEIAQKNHLKSCRKFQQLSDLLLTKLKKHLPKIKLNGHPKQRLASNLNLSIPNLNGQELLLKLSEQKIYISTGASCNATSNKPSQTLQAIGLTKPQILSSIRITFGHNNNSRQIIKTANTIIKIAKEKEKQRHTPL